MVTFLCNSCDHMLSYCCATLQLGVTGKQTGMHYGLSMEETKDLWEQADVDGNGIIDYEEFQVMY